MTKPNKPAPALASAGQLSLTPAELSLLMAYRTMDQRAKDGTLRIALRQAEEGAL